MSQRRWAHVEPSQQPPRGRPSGSSGHGEREHRPAGRDASLRRPASLLQPDHKQGRPSQAPDRAAALLGLPCRCGMPPPARLAVRRCPASLWRESSSVIPRSCCFLCAGGVCGAGGDRWRWVCPAACGTLTGRSWGPLLVSALGFRLAAACTGLELPRLLQSGNAQPCFSPRSRCCRCSASACCRCCPALLPAWLCGPLLPATPAAQCSPRAAVRMTWNVWPHSRLEAAKCVVPFSTLYTPAKQTSQLQVGSGSCRQQTQQWGCCCI